MIFRWGARLYRLRKNSKYIESVRAVTIAGEGHGFSRAVKASNNLWASAPEVRSRTDRRLTVKENVPLGLKAVKVRGDYGTAKPVPFS